jgi:DNA-binding ferritin-like protein
MANPSLEALKKISQEMRKKGIEKIAMVGKSSPETVSKLEKLSEPKEEEEEEKEESSEEGSDLGDKLELIKKLLGKV